MNNNPQILIYGYGNPGRQDDGLGILLTDRVEQWAKQNNISDIAFDTNYQLNLEDAHEIADKDIVIFADASADKSIDEFALRIVEPSPEVEFTMHAVSPAFILNLCQDIYDKHPATYLLHIKGYDWEMKEELTAQAQINLDNAFDFLIEKLNDPQKLIEYI